MSIHVSVIIPHLNEPAALARALQRLDCQKAPGVEFEIIVADNGSSVDLPQSIVSHPRVIVVRETTPGPGLARNRGVLRARGDILAFIDADCEPDAAWIQTIFNHFQDRDRAPVIGGEVRIAPRGDGLEPLEAYESIFGYRSELYIRRDGYAPTCNMAMRQEVFNEVGPFHGIQIAEDRDWGQRATRAGYSPGFLPEMIVFTAARESFLELARKWDRHIAHDFAEVHGSMSRFAWALRSFALAISPIAEIPRVIASGRITGRRARALAWCVLFRIRLYRARRMLQLLVQGDPKAMAMGWRKK